MPNADLPAVLAGICALLRPGGLFFLGVYGVAGEDESREGVAEDDNHRPQRFFSWRSDAQIQEFARAAFQVEDFHVVEVGRDRCQCLTLRA